MLSVQSGGSSCHGRGIRGRFCLINQTPGGSLVRALRARVGILLLITDEFSTEGLRAYSPYCHTLCTSLDLIVSKILQGKSSLPSLSPLYYSFII